MTLLLLLRTIARYKTPERRARPGGPGDKGIPKGPGRPR